ncbi:MAG: hypothetical protein AAGG11_00770 [Pseudomonadota bacterium]
MNSDRNRSLALPAGAPVGYMERTRLFYEAQGYARSYRWAHFEDVPFTPLRKPLSEARLVLVTTASPLRESAAATTGDTPIGATLLKKKALARRPVADPPSALYTDDLSWDKEATHTRDLASYFPLRELATRVADGRLGSLTASYFCVPTEYSQRQTIEDDAPAIRTGALEEGADIALLVPL